MPSQVDMSPQLPQRLTSRALTLAIAQDEIDATLNSTMLSTFLMGAYTIVYFGTLYAYLTRKASQRWGVITAITILYVLCLVQLALQWYALQWEFITNGQTIKSIFYSILGNPQWLVVANFVTSYLVVVVADGLLVWRCFHVWNRSFRVIMVPLFLFVSETALIISAIILNGVQGSLVLTKKDAITMNSLLSAGFFVSFATSIISTVLIAYRIYIVYAEDGKSVRRFKYILDIIVQSAAINSIPLLLTAITLVLPDSGNVANAPLFALGDYAKAFFVAISGLAPTVMVARIAFTEGDTTYVSTAPKLSGLQFNRGQTTTTSSSFPEIVGEKTRTRIDGVRSLKFPRPLGCRVPYGQSVLRFARDCTSPSCHVFDY